MDLGPYRFGLPVEAVERALRMLAITPLSEGPAILRGVVDLAGEVVPVLDLRPRLRLPDCPLKLSEQLLLVRTPRRRLALRVDRTLGVEEVDLTEVRSAEEVLPELRRLQGVVAIAGELVLIQDLEALLSLEQEQALDHALREGGGR